MIEIKEVSPTQFEEIWPIFQEVALSGETYPYLPNITKEEAKAQWFATNAHVFIAYDEGKPIATRYIVPNKTGLGSHVCNMGVMIDKSYRGKGLGYTMLEFGIDKAKELGYRAIQLNLVVSTNAASIKLCKKYGFEIIGTLPEAFFYKQQKYIDAFVMYKKLV
jgi:RimJ/RimL family protein N-acetyltransferase